MRQRLLSAFCRIALRYPRAVILVGLALGAAAFWFTHTRLKLLSTQSSLLSEKYEFNRRYMEYEKEFGDLEGFVVAVEYNGEPAIRFARALAEKVGRHPEKFRDVFWKAEPGELERKGFYYLSEKEIADLRNTLAAVRPDLEKIGAEPSLERLFSLLSRRTSFVEASYGEEDREKGLNLEVLEAILRQMRASLEGRPVRRQVWRTLFPRGEPEEEETLNLDGNKKFLFVLVEPRIDPENEHPSSLAALKFLRQLAEEARRAEPGARIGITGRWALAAEEMATSEEDIRRATLVATAGLLLLYLWTLRGVAQPLLLLANISLGMAWTFGAVALTIGHLNLLSIVFAPMLLGIADDYGVNFLARFQERYRERRSLEEALRGTYDAAGPPILAACGTTAAAFCAMILTGFRGIQELGLITAMGLWLCCVEMLTVFPASLYLLERWRHRTGRLARAAFLRLHEPPSPILAAAVRRPVPLLLLLCLAAAVSLWVALRQRFDYNLLRLQPAGVESVLVEERLLRETDRSVWFGAVVCDDLEEARQQQKALEGLPEVSAVVSILKALPENPEGRRRQLKELRRLWPALRMAEIPEKVDLPALRNNQDRFGKNLRAARAVARLAGQDSAVARISGLLDSLEEIRRTLDSLPPETAARRLSRFQAGLFGELRSELGLLEQNLTAAPPRPADLPESLRRRFIGKTGKVLLMVYPKENLWEWEPLSRFVARLEEKAPGATGGPVQIYYSGKLLREGFERAGWYAFWICLAIASYSLRSVFLGFLSLLPVGFGLLWTAGLMPLAGLRFNPANLMLLPLAVGLGVDTGLFLVHRWKESRTMDALLGLSTVRAVSLANLTTMIGFGVLLSARHRGLQSLGAVMTMALGFTLLAALFLLPSALRLFRKP